MQVCTAVMHYGFRIVEDMIDGLSNWMDDKGFATIYDVAGKSLPQVAKDLDLTESALRNWVTQAEVDEGKAPAGALTTVEREELVRLRKENRQLTMERNFLKKQRCAQPVNATPAAVWLLEFRNPGSCAGAGSIVTARRAPS